MKPLFHFVLLLSLCTMGCLANDEDGDIVGVAGGEDRGVMATEGGARTNADTRDGENSPEDMGFSEDRDVNENINRMGDDGTPDDRDMTDTDDLGDAGDVAGEDGMGGEGNMVGGSGIAGAGGMAGGSGMAGAGGMAGGSGMAGAGGMAGEDGMTDECNVNDCPPVVNAVARNCANASSMARSACRRNDDGICQWVFECPEEVPCTELECADVLAPALPSMICPDGINMSGRGPCTRQSDWRCGYSILSCPPEGGVCQPNTEFSADDGCNQCFCPPSGRIAEARCTQRACPPELALCTPGQQVPASDGCNTCECPQSGRIIDATDCTEIACPSSCRRDADCESTEFCDYVDDSCGLIGEGECTQRPELCPAGGAGACGCDGTVRTNRCELGSAGSDVFKFGGCGFGDMSTFRCGIRACDGNTELCRIVMNDIVGPNQPEFFSTCEALPDGCQQGDCSCFNNDSTIGSPRCFDGTGKTILMGLSR